LHQSQAANYNRRLSFTFDFFTNLLESSQYFLIEKLSIDSIKNTLKIYAYTPLSCLNHRKNMQALQVGWNAASK